VLKGIFFCDVDGTILPHGQGAIEPRFFEVVRTAHRRGYLVCISSGRIFCSLQPLFVEVEDLVVFSACNGCMIVYQGEELIPNHTIGSHDAEEMVNSLLKWGAIPLISSTDGLHLPKKIEHHARSLHYLNRPTTKVFEHIDQVDAPVLQLTALCNDNIETVIANSRLAWQERYHVTTTGPQMFDICPTTKGESLILIAEHYGIDRSKTWAFGDNENDIPMLRAAGKGYLMHDAHPTLHDPRFEHCDDVSQTMLAIMESAVTKECY
jgi:Cof subfamily protein (haloacid dehalogenase superfamily)